MALVHMNLYQQQHHSNINIYKQCSNTQKDLNRSIHVDMYTKSTKHHVSTPTAILLLLLLKCTSTTAADAFKVCLISKVYIRIDFQKAN